MRLLVVILIVLSSLAAPSAYGDIFEKCAEWPKSTQACERALSDVERAIERDGMTITRLYLRGVLRVETGDYAGGIQDLTKVVETPKRDSYAYRRRGEAHHNSGDLTFAIADYDEAITLDQTDPYPLIYKAAALVDLGRRGEARALLNNLPPPLQGEPNVALFSGQIFIRLDEPERARLRFEEALRINPNMRAAQEAQTLTNCRLGVERDLLDEILGLMISQNGFISTELADIRSKFDQSAPSLDDDALYEMLAKWVSDRCPAQSKNNLGETK